MPFTGSHRHITGVFESLIHQLRFVAQVLARSENPVPHRNVSGQQGRTRRRANRIGIKPIHLKPFLYKLIEIRRSHLPTMIPHVSPTLVVSNEDQNIRLRIRSRRRWSGKKQASHRNKQEDCRHPTENSISDSSKHCQSVFKKDAVRQGIDHRALMWLMVR